MTAWDEVIAHDDVNGPSPEIVAERRALAKRDAAAPRRGWRAWAYEHGDPDRIDLDPEEIAALDAAFAADHADDAEEEPC